MDNSIASNPQHYQPLSHALNPPFNNARPRSPYSATPSTYAQDSQHQAIDHTLDQVTHGESGRHDEEEEEEEEEVEGAVDPAASTAPGVNPDGQSASANSATATAPQRRKPGRPKGSKNKKPRFDMSGVPPKAPFSATPFYGYPPPPPTVVPMQPHPPPHPVPVATPFPNDANNSQYYDFQWRVLTLCSEFYNAADELIRGAPPHIVSLCFSLPGNQVDPISILHEARRACDQLMANPSQTVLKAPAPANGTFAAATSPPGKPASPTIPAAPTPPVITNPGSFVMSLTAPPVQGAYPGYAAAPNRYPTNSYYAYATTTHATGAHPYMSQQQVMKPVNLSTPAAAGNQGAWSDEEVEKLRKLAEESRTQGSSTEQGEIDWDWVCAAWGPGRTRHQILIKATNIGMKESSTRGLKRQRRDADVAADGSANTTSTQQVLNAVGAAAAATSQAVTPDRPASTAISSAAPSPVVAHQQTPAPLPPQPPGGGTIMQWPMPHVAANTPSPVITSATTRSAYYRTDRQKA